MRAWLSVALLVGGIAMLSSACATSEEWSEWRNHTTHFASGTHGMFSRSLRLPAPVDGAKVNAVFKSGLLTVTVPKAPEAKASTIPIKVG